MIDLDESLKQIIQKLILKVSTNGELQQFRTQFEQRKIYNRRQKSYIENEKIKQQLGPGYESQSSDSDNQLDSFGYLSKYEMKSMLKDNLIKLKFDSTKLSYIEPPSIQQDETQRELMIQNEEIRDQSGQRGQNRKKTVKIDTRNLSIINENKTSNLLPKKNLKALNFVIEQLQKLIKQG